MFLLSQILGFFVLFWTSLPFLRENIRYYSPDEGGDVTGGLVVADGLEVAGGLVLTAGAFVVVTGLGLLPEHDTPLFIDLSLALMNFPESVRTLSSPTWLGDVPGLRAAEASGASSTAQFAYEILFRSRTENLKVRLY